MLSVAVRYMIGYIEQAIGSASASWSAQQTCGGHRGRDAAGLAAVQPPVLLLLVRLILLFFVGNIGVIP